MRNLLSFLLWYENSYIHNFYLKIDVSFCWKQDMDIHNFDPKMGMFPSMVLNRI